MSRWSCGQRGAAGPSEVGSSRTTSSWIPLSCGAASVTSLHTAAGEASDAAGPPSAVTSPSAVAAASVVGPQGMHVFFVSEVKKSDLKPFPEMKEQLSRELRRHEMDKQTQTWIEELRKKAYIDIKLQ